MSKNLAEPSTQRFISGHGYRIRQLETRPAPLNFLAELGGSWQNIPLWVISLNPNRDTADFTWTKDTTASTGGYMTNEASAADTEYFDFMVQMKPRNSIWGMSWRYYIGNNYGKHRIKLASLAYEPTDRPSGNPEGKIQDYVPVEGDPLVYVNLGSAEDAYTPAAEAENFHNGIFTFIPGGDPGDSLSAIGALGSDPMTGFNISDGGPGWYRIRFEVEGKNAASAGFKTRIVCVAFGRLDDAGSF